MIGSNEKHTCNVCGHKYELKAENRYTACQNKGLSEMFVPAVLYDAFDCPKCGCQNIVGVREERLVVAKEGEEDVQM